MARFNHGLHGRERYLHQKIRNERQYQRQMLDEYFEPDRGRRPSRRYVPIRRRSEFVAETVAVSTAVNNPVTPSPVPDSETSVGTAYRNRPHESAIRFDNRTASGSAARRLVNVIAAPTAGRISRSTFTWRGFLTGCAMGGIAAVLGLFVLRTIAG